ncbi:YlbF family regulator [Desulforudis sp. 1088]|uniref:YlbF family regulator n=1 Tax=unclassified Candidatus Desulforudis TaxID=2635950 RepID=UPI003470FE3A
MSVLRKAHELAKEMENSPTVQDWRAAESRLQEDEAANAILLAYERIQLRVEEARSGGRALSPDEERELREVTDRMEAHPTLREVMRARGKLNDLLHTVQEIIHIAVYGKPSKIQTCSQAAARRDGNGPIEL